MGALETVPSYHLFIMGLSPSVLANTLLKILKYDS